ncbi:hypothetical protein ACH5RR_038337 [Cinchona calisaya]|uniref:MADS-box domain-containing protein n=1 Tax=Cinchona calisaya TaxID=153742 RepID=A0ABD2XUZ4_9GENT
MVRRKVEIEKIEDKSKRQVAFSKRRKGLFKKAEELCRKCDCQLAIITFSMAGNLFAWGHPCVESIVDQYAAYNAENNNNNKKKRDTNLDLSLALRVDEEKELNSKRFCGDEGKEVNSKRFGKKKVDCEKRGLFVGDKKVDLPKVDNLEMEELQELMVKMEELKKKVVDRANEIRTKGLGSGSN